MKRSITSCLVAAALLAAGVSACNSAGSGNSDAASSDASRTVDSAASGNAAVVNGADNTDNSAVGTGSAAEEQPEAKGAGAIGTVTTVSGKPLPQGSVVDYSTGAHAAPVFSWKNKAGQSRSLEDYRGKVVMVNFWGTWCPPCRRELPDIVRLRDKMADKGLEVIGVAIGEENRLPAGVTVEQHLAEFAGNNDLRYPLVVGNGDIINHYGGISAVPTTFIVNREGKIVNMLVGGMSEERFQQVVEAAM